MDAETVNQLAKVNRVFYSQFSANFSDSRSSERFNLEPLLKFLAKDIHLLDIGCGNGRLAGALERGGFSLHYLGLDSSPELVALAEKKSGALKNVRAQFRVLDLQIPNWSDNLRAFSPFDLVVCLAVLHHIPGFELRANVLRQIRAVLRPRGVLVMSNWQFLNNARLRKKIVPWETLNMDPRRLEPGDYLLDWKRGGTGYRYVHLMDEKQANELAGATGFQVLEQFHADNNLNLYSILQS